MSEESESLRQRAAAGDAGAQTQWAMHLDQGGQHEEALVWLGQAAERGFATAQYLLGARLVVGRAAQFDPSGGARWVSAAARQGMPEALALMAMLATFSADWTAAVTMLQEAGRRGHARARGQAEVLGKLKATESQPWRAPAKPRWQFEAPRVGVIERFIPRVFCDWIIRSARPKLEAVRVKDPVHGGARQVDYRSNAGAGFSLLDSDLIVQMVNARIADAIGVPLDHQEPTNVLHYRPGEEYRAHHDYLSRSSQHEAELRAVGQRTTTVLVYLNGNYEGGETDFPTLGWRFKGRPGDALVFWNTTPEGEPDERTLHAGLPVESGEKWLFSKWVRARPYPPA